MLLKPTMHRAIRVTAAMALTLGVLIQAALALEVPPLRARVNDHAGMLSAGVVRQLDLLLKDPSAALRFILRHCGVLLCTPHSSTCLRQAGIRAPCI